MTFAQYKAYLDLLRRGGGDASPPNDAQVQSVSNGPFSIYFETDDPVTTTDGTQVAAFSFDIPLGRSIVVDVVVVGAKSDNSKSNLYKKTTKYRNEASVVTQSSVIDNAPSGPIDDATWGGVTLDASGTTGRLLITGKAATAITWGFAVAIYEVKP